MINYKNFFSGLLIFAFIFQISKFYTFYLEYSDWQYADWLINYQGGFIRRGFIGEILFQIQRFSLIDLDILVLLFVVLLYLILIIILIRSLKFLDDSKLDTLIFLSPGFFLYPIMNSEIIGRKEILLFVILGLFVFFEKYIKNKYLLIITIMSIFLISFTHSGLLFYSPYLLFLYFLIRIDRSKTISLIEITSIIFSLIIIFAIIYLNQGSKPQVLEICNSIKDYIKDGCVNRGQFFWLHNPMSNHINVKLRSDLLNNFLVYLPALILVFLFLSLKLYLSEFRTNNLYLNKRNPFMIFLILFILTIPIYILGYDWGRYISISYFSSYFLHIFLIKKRNIKFDLKNFIFEKKFPKKLFFVFVFLYAFTWSFPFYGAKDFKYPLKKPLIQLQKVLSF